MQTDIRNEQSSALPIFSNARQAATLQIPPPFSFQGVNCRVFPLRANMAQLTHFCNQFINDGIPSEIVYFRPAMPIVFLQLIYYGKMAVDTRNYGWFSQHELVFSVPVERYRLVDGRPRFEGWGLINPFIYVDKDSSEIIGREVYGWPKVHGWLHADVSEWLDDPRAERRMAAFDTMVYGDVYSGRAQRPHTLIEVFEKPPMTITRFPPDVNEFMKIPQAAVNFWQILQTMWQNLANLATGTAITWVDNYPVKGIKPLTNSIQDLGKIASLIPKVLPVTEENHYSLLTLKQFRDAQDPRFACYQALISSEMYLDQFNAGGMLGDPRLLTGDPTGGYSLRIYEFPSQPVVASLGLERESQTRSEDGTIVSTFKPVLPFWMNVDISYDKGEIICSQTRWSDWEEGNQPTYPLVEDAPRRGATPITRPLSVQDLQDSHLYNTSRGEAIQALTGPFYFPNATLRVLPLLADKKTLQNYVTRNYDQASQRFEVTGNMVYMIITNFDEMSSPTNNVGRWTHREVRFSIPVRWYDDRKDKDRFVSMAMVSPFVFCDRDTAMNTMREVFGEPAFEAGIESPPGSWLDVDGPRRGPCVTEVHTDVLPALFVGSQMERRRLISVSHEDVLEQFDYEGWNRIASEWGQELIRNLAGKEDRARKAPKALMQAKALALELLANGKPFNQITFKQFRDAHNIERACYQALVNTETCFDYLWDLQLIEHKLHVCIDEYPSQPIVEQLGLVVKWRSAVDQPLRCYLQPISPFWMKVALKTGEATVIAERGGASEWRYHKPWLKDAYFNQSGPCDVGAGLAESLDDATRFARKWPSEKEIVARATAPKDALTPGSAEDIADVDGPGTRKLWEHFLDARNRNQYLKLAAQDWKERAAPEELLQRNEARKILESDEVVDPQMVIESLLSHEWAHWGNPRFFRRTRQESITQLPEFCIRRDSVGTAAHTLFPPNESMECGTGGWYPRLEERPEDRNSSSADTGEGGERTEDE